MILKILEIKTDPFSHKKCLGNVSPLLKPKFNFNYTDSYTTNALVFFHKVWSGDPGKSEESFLQFLSRQ